MEPTLTRSASQQFESADLDGSGQLDKKELRRALTQRSLPCSQSSIDNFFSRADRNGDGLVDKAEFLSFVENQEKALRKVYEKIDANADGKLTVRQPPTRTLRCPILHASLPLTPKGGHLSSQAEELKSAASSLGYSLSNDQVRSVLRRADSDQDGTLSFAELRDFLLLLPSVNPRAVFEAFGAELLVDHAIGEATPPIELARALGAERTAFLSVLASKLYSGSVAGAVSRTLTAPIDRLKMVMQFDAAAASGGMMGAVRLIYAEGGFPAFFRGNSVNVLKIAPETSIKLIAFDTLKGAIAADPASITVTERFAAGGIAGAMAQIAVYPLEIAKTRLAVSAPGTYVGLADCLRSMARHEGLGALYKGLATSIVGIVPYAGVDLGVNSLLKEFASSVYMRRSEEPGVVTVLGCGMLSSSCAMLLTYPLNLIRTRLQASGMPGAPEYDGAVDCFRQAIRTRGVAGLYQGILPNLLKVLPSTSISYAIFDLMSRKK